MSKFRKVMFAMIAAELLIIIAGNIVCVNKVNNDAGRIYRVECQRVASDLADALEGAEDVDALLENYDMTPYETVIGVGKYNPEDICNEDYIVAQIDGQLYRIMYRATADYYIIYVVNGILIAMFLLSILVLVYVDRKVFKPFQSMQNLSIELAKGNLSAPVKEEKSRFFGRFLWSMDVLRENLEEKKEKELKLHKERKTLILSLSHDIKTPLSAIELYLKALRDGIYDNEVEKEEAYRGIQKNVEEIKSYVNGITQASREDFLNLEVKNGEVYLSDLIGKIRAYYREKLTVKHIDFSVDEVPDCLLWGDGERLVEVLQNIMENAIKYGDGDRISISFDEEEGCKLIKCSNTGDTPGEEELPHLMESFYRGSNHGNAKGSGLGLYICKNLMRKMDGDIFVKMSENLFSVTVVVKKA